MLVQRCQCLHVSSYLSVLLTSASVVKRTAQLLYNPSFAVLFYRHCSVSCSTNFMGPQKACASNKHHPRGLLVLQVVEAAYLIYRGRYFLPIVVLVVGIVTNIFLAISHHRVNKRVRALMNEVRLTPVVQDRWVRAMSSHRLVPGDVVVMQQGRALADLVLLRGACLVSESMLSGEVGLCSSGTNCCSMLSAQCSVFCLLESSTAHPANYKHIMHVRHPTGPV